MIALLHNIRSLHNVGSIFRTADGAGIEKLYLCGITPSPLDRFKVVRPQIAKVALGAEKTVKWEKHSSTFEVIDQLKKEGHYIVAVEQDKNAIPYFNFRLTNLQINPDRSRDPDLGRGRSTNLALIMGSEVAGLPQTILAKADTIIDIPMRGNKESLNVSVAFGIIVFHFVMLNH